jgi:hypothetical protein
MTSRVGMGAELGVAELTSLISQKVPETLAHEKNRSIGMAGRVDYTVTRGDIALHTTPEALQISMPLDGKIDVCKPLGPFCPDYGHCKPKWDVKINVPTNYSEDPRLRARPSVELANRCVLQPVGYDATSELERITHDQARQIKDRINGELGRVQGKLDDAWTQLAEPSHIAPGVCVSWHSERLEYAAPKINDKVLSAAAELVGQLDTHCPGRPESEKHEGDEQDGTPGAEYPGADHSTKETRPPYVARTDLSPQVNITAEIEWSFADVSAAMRATGHDFALSATSRASKQDAADRDQPNRLWLGVPKPGCVEWVPVEPRIVGTTLRFAAPEGADDLPAELGALELPLPKSYLGLGHALDDVHARLDRAKAELREEGFSLATDTHETPSVRVAAEDLHLGLSLIGSASATLAKSKSKD